MRAPSPQSTWRGLTVLLALCAAVSSARGWTLEFEVRSTRSGPLFLYIDTGRGFHDQQLAIVNLAADEQWQAQHFTLPQLPIHALRLDPMAGPAEIELRHLRLREPTGAIRSEIPVTALRALQQVAVEVQDDQVHLQVPVDADDPFLLIDAPFLAHTLSAKPPSLWPPSRVFPVLAWSALALLVIGPLWLVWRHRHSLEGWQRALWALGSAVVAGGIQLWRYGDFVSWAPYLDQWTGEFRTLLLPFEYGTLRWADLLAPHHEHRITLTRLASLTLRILNGEWDNRALVLVGWLLQMVGNAAFHLLALRYLPLRRALVVIAINIAIVAALSDWSNQVSGFQLQFHGLVTATLLTFGLVAAPGERGWRWTAATLASASGAAVAMASGLTTAIVAAGGSALAGLSVQHRRRPKPHVVLIAALGGLAVAAWWTRPDFAAHASLRPPDWLAVINNTIAYASWPLPGSAASAILLWWPFVMLTIRTMRSAAWRPFSGFVVLMGVWTLLQIGSLGYARSILNDHIASRYTGLLNWTLITNASALAILYPLQQPTRRIGIGVALLWGTLAMGALAWRSEGPDRLALHDFRAETRHHEERLRVYFRKGDERVLTQAPLTELPYPHGAHLVALLQDPHLQQILPAPLRREHAREVDPVKAAQVQSGWLTALARSAFAHGPWILLGGGVLVLGATWLRRRPS